MSKAFIKSVMVVTCKQVDYEKDGVKKSFVRMETVRHGKKWTVKCSTENAEKYGLPRIKNGDMYKLTNVTFNEDKASIYNTLWLRSFDGCEPYSFDDDVINDDDDDKN